MIGFSTLRPAQALTFAFDDEEVAGIKTLDFFTVNLHNVMVFPLFFLCVSLVFQFYVLEYGIHFCGRDFWIVLFVPFHIFICLRVTYQYMWFSHSCYTRTCNLYLLLWSSLRLFAMHLNSANQAFPGNLHPSGFPSGHWYWFATALMFVQKTWRRFEGLFFESLDILVHIFGLRIDSPWLTLRLWAKPVSHLMLETFRRRPCQAIRGMTCKRHFSCGYFNWTTDISEGHPLSCSKLSPISCSKMNPLPMMHV